MKRRNVLAVCGLLVLVGACSQSTDTSDSSQENLGVTPESFWDRLQARLSGVADAAEGDWKTPAPNNRWAKGFRPTRVGQENILPDEDSTFDRIADDIQEIQRTLQASNNGELQRAFHAKPHACVKGKLSVHVPDSIVTDARLPADTDIASLKVGLLAQTGEHDVWVRWSNGVGGRNRPDGEVDVRGLALKVMDVTGDRLPDGRRFFEQEQGTQDFLMTNGATTPAPNSESFAGFGTSQANMAVAQGLVEKTAALGKFLGYLGDNPRVGATLLRKVLPGTKNHDSVVGQQFYSGGAIALGVDDAGNAREAIKFSAITGRWDGTSCVRERDEHQALKDFVLPGGDGIGDPNYLSTGKPRGVKTYLQAGQVCVDFRVQFQRHDADMLAAQSQPIEDTSVEWLESDSPSVSVATVVIPQMADPSADEETCNELSWNPWHGLADHRPLGNIMRVRQEVLAASASLRGAKTFR